jgi:ABC-type transport system involved in cytochrome bd biosynthesis fused ATPase/permease subunit
VVFFSATNLNLYLFQINNFSFGYPGGEHNLINNFYLHLEDGQKAILLGSNGVGKSSVLKALWESSFEKAVLPLSRAYFSQDILASLSFLPQKFDLTFYEIMFETTEQEFPEISFESIFEWLSNVVGTIPKDYSKRLSQNLFELKLSSGFLAEKYLT